MTEEQPPQPPPQGFTPQGFTPRGYGHYTPEPPATSKATLALVLGIVGLTVCPGAASIPAWIIGNEAIKEIDSSNGAAGGRSMAVAGRVTGIIGTVLGGLGLLAIGAIFVVSALIVSSVEDCFDDNSTGYSSECH
jgi:hypothetical protein